MGRRVGLLAALGAFAGVGLAQAETANGRVDAVKLLLHPEPGRVAVCGHPSGDWRQTVKVPGLSYALECRPTAIPGRWVYGVRFFNSYPHPLSFAVALSHPGGRGADVTASVAACAETGEVASFVLPTPCGLAVDVDVHDAAAGAKAR